METQKQFILLNYLMNIGLRNSTLPFAKQLLTSDADMEIKKFISEMLQKNKNNIQFNIGNDLVSLIEESSSFPQLMLKLDLCGIDSVAGDLIFYLLANNKMDWLRQMLDYDRKIIEKNFDICDLLEDNHENRN